MLVDFGFVMGRPMFWITAAIGTACSRPFVGRVFAAIFRQPFDQAAYLCCYCLSVAVAARRWLAGRSLSFRRASAF